MKEFVKCNLCGKDCPKPVFKIGGHKIVRCRNCSLMYVNPRLKEKFLHKIYTKNYFENPEFKNHNTQNLFGYDLYIEEKEDIISTFKKRLDVIEKYKKSGKILDVGCATGFFLKLAKSRGWDVYGTDMSKFASEYAKKKGGLRNIFYGDLKKVKFKDNMFDVITMFDVIEHLPDPKNTLKHIYKLLRKNGLIVITTPDSGSIVAKLLGRRWEEFRRAREHTYFFSKKTLFKMLKKTDFKILKVQSAGRYFSLKSAVKRGKIYFKKTFTILQKIVDFLCISNKKIFVNPHYKITVYARKK